MMKCGITNKVIKVGLNWPTFIFFLQTQLKITHYFLPPVNKFAIIDVYLGFSSPNVL